MTPDDYTTAARAEAERYFADPGVDPLTLSVIDHAMHMAEWARVYLSQQEPSEDEVDAAATAICSGENGCDPCFNWDESVEGGCTYCTRHARAALRAARDVRGQA